MTVVKNVLPVTVQSLHVLFLIATGYVLNATLRLHTPVLWIRSFACLLLAVTLWMPVRFRWVGAAMGLTLYGVSFFNPYRLARVTAYLQQTYF